MAEFKLGRMTLKSLFSKPATKLYPIEAPTYFDETKGQIQIDIDHCRFDGSCANLCPTGALEVDRKEYTWAIDRFKCIQCRTCIDVCFEHVLSMDNHYADPATAHTVSVFEVSPADRARREREAAEKAAKAARLKEEAAAKKKAAAEAKARQEAAEAAAQDPAQKPAQKPAEAAAQEPAAQKPAEAAGPAAE
jgi:formate hydrogenlyase subunit 6/NADH:ubiquinone oxidoreductase subunit I